MIAAASHRNRHGRVRGPAKRLAALVVVMLLADGGLSRAAGPPEMSRAIESNLRLIKFSIQTGRIRASSDHFDRQNTSTASGPEGRQERMTINLTTGLASLEYEGTMPSGRFSLAIEEGAAVRFSRVRNVDGGPPVSVEFQQPATGALTFRWGPAEARQEVRAPSLWHLLLAHPAAAKEDLIPVLGFLRLDWDLDGTVLKIEEALVRAATGGRIPDRDRWSTLVAQLGSDEYAQRRAADRQLRMAGQSVVPFLEALDPAQLDAEQRLRIRQIVQTLSGSQREDTPQSAAAWLSVDPRVWFTLLSRDDLSLRQVALEQLGRLMGAPIDFDPQADPATRQAQLAALGPVLFPTSGVPAPSARGPVDAPTP